MKKKPLQQKMGEGERSNTYHSTIVGQKFLFFFLLSQDSLHSVGVFRDVLCRCHSFLPIQLLLLFSLLLCLSKFSFHITSTTKVILIQTIFHITYLYTLICQNSQDTYLTICRTPFNLDKFYNQMWYGLQKTSEKQLAKQKYIG